MRKALIVLAAVPVAGILAIPALAATTTVRIGDDYFVKKGAAPKVTVKKGTTVKWLWKGKSPHNVTVTKGPTKFSSKTITKGSFSKRVTKPGTYAVVCTLHLPKMKMTLAVK